MKAEIVSIGDEMTTGQRLDTNSRWLSQRLADMGIETIRHTTVADDLATNVTVFKEAAARAEIVVASGGLGPTLDDLTRQALALAFDVPLELDQASLEHIEGMFATRGRPMPPRNRSQACLPRGSQIIPNPHGTAPGIDLPCQRGDGSISRLFALPGVPSEMMEMWHGSVEPRIAAMQGTDSAALRFHTLRIFGLGESDVELKLPELMHRDREPRVGITVSRATISLRIGARAGSQAEFERLIEPTVAEIKAALGVLVFGTGEDELQQAIVAELQQLGLTLAVVEIGGRALASDWLSSASSDAVTCLRGMLSFPNFDLAAKWLQRWDPPTGQLSTSSGMSDLARAIRSIFDTDIGLAFGTYPSLTQLTGEKPRAEVDVAISTDRFPPVEKRCILIGHPDILHDRIAKTALNTLRLALVRNG